ncbi:MAG: SDR family NAD(P)-dependent oxidoreductase [Actinobacteria bacterium]|nr:SDR family NAD(P)-dependent oxidoreductase [Actinomycetota bacterium]
MANTDTWALVTGACSGIGFEIAQNLAARGYSLLLVSDRASELEQAAHRIGSSHGVSAQTVSMDLARPDAAGVLHEEVRRRGLDVEVLISNAGFLLFGEVAECDPCRANAILQLHVVTPSLLARHFGADMRARRKGHILLVSSASAWTDFPGTAYYGSSKRYLRSFAASLREELRPWGVNVTCLAPGAVATDLYDRGNGAAKAAARFGLMKDPAEVAAAALDGMFRHKAVVLPGASAKLMAAGSALMPRCVVRFARMHTGFLPRPQD